MAKIKQSVAVGQYFNPKWDANTMGESGRYVYYVERTVNTLWVKVGQWLSASEVEKLIENGVNVTVTKPKD